VVELLVGLFWYEFLGDNRLNECLCKVDNVKFQILCSCNRDHGPSGCTARCGAEGVVVVDVLLRFQALYDEASFES